MARIHSTLSAVAISVQSGLVCPSRRQGLTSSQTNIVSWWDLSDDNDLITAFIVFFGWEISHLQLRFSHNCLSGKIWASMFLRYSRMLVNNCTSSLPPYVVTITLTDLSFSLQWLTLIFTVSRDTLVFPVPKSPQRNTFRSGFSTDNTFVNFNLSISIYKLWITDLLQQLFLNVIQFYPWILGDDPQIMCEEHWGGEARRVRRLIKNVKREDCQLPLAEVRLDKLLTLNNMIRLVCKFQIWLCMNIFRLQI